MGLFYKSAVFICFWCIWTGLSCQTPDASLIKNEASMQLLFSEMANAKTDEQKRMLNDSVSSLLYESLQMQGSFEYGFDSLKHVGKILSDDRKVRFFTWNLSLNNATSDYSGFIQYKKDSKIQVTRLTDISDSIFNPGAQTLDAHHWYGCLVYDIIDKKSEDRTYYTLLCFRPQNLFVTSKLMDVLYFENDEPVFGKALFRLDGKILHRVIFEYSAKVSMSLTWNKQMDMIIFDHLIPAYPAQSGNYQYYVPDLSFDGMKFEKGFWNKQDNVDVRNKP